MFTSEWLRSPAERVEEFVDAAAAGNLAFVVAQVAAGRVDVNAKIKGYGGYTALHKAVLNSHVDVVDALLKRGADVNARTGEGSWAGSWSHVDDLDRLVLDFGLCVIPWCTRTVMRASTAVGAC